MIVGVIIVLVVFIFVVFCIVGSANHDRDDYHDHIEDLWKNDHFHR